MADHSTSKLCIIIGASHAGVNCAFALRKEGWQGEITLFDADPELPYHRPPLSKTYLNSENEQHTNPLKSVESYAKERITLHLGSTVQAIHPKEKNIELDKGGLLPYDKLVLATGARPLIPPIKDLDNASNVFPMRNAADAANICKAFHNSPNKRVAIIGGGYIGLETAASLKKLGAIVSVLEREDRILARVTTPEMSTFFENLHREKGVEIFTRKNVTAIEKNGDGNELLCADGSRFLADIIVVGVGIKVNKELAESAGLDIENGICVNARCQTSQKDIYAIGDCTFHYNPHYKRYLRLESVQNAVDQAKVAAAAICGRISEYHAIPWFWSDQYDVKLQMVGLSTGFDQALCRKEPGGHRFSIWYFKDDTLLAVDAVNNPKAYVLGTKFIKNQKRLDKTKLVDPSIEFKPANLIVD